MTYYSIAGNSTLDSDEIVSRLEELRDMAAKETFEVYRVRNGEVISTFDDSDEADEFITEEDYDPDRVLVRTITGKLDSDEAEELEELERINSDGESFFDDWGDILVTRENEVDPEQYARDYIRDNYGTRGNDTYNALEAYVNWDDLGESLLEDVEQGSIAGYTYLYL